MTLTVPYPPSANRYWRTFRGRTVVSAEAREYKRQVWLTALTQTKEKPTAAPVELILRVYRPRRAGDLSNRIKVLEDALIGIAFEDDSQVVRIMAVRREDKKNPRVEVEVNELKEEP